MIDLTLLDAIVAAITQELSDQPLEEIVPQSIALYEALLDAYAAQLVTCTIPTVQPRLFSAAQHYLQ